MRNNQEVTLIVMQSVNFYIKLFLNKGSQLKLESKVSGFEQTSVKFNPMLGRRVKARVCAKIFLRGYWEAIAYTDKFHMVALIGHGRDGCMTFVRILKCSGAFLFLLVRFF